MSSPVALVAADPTEGGRYCGAKTRPGAAHPFCRKRAGQGTDHLGQGRCENHGGKTPIKHGRYSKVQHTRIREIMEASANELEDPLDIFPEMRACRALFVDFIERYDITTAALLAWHESYEVTRIPIDADKIRAFERVVDEWEIYLRDISEPTETQMEDAGLARKYIDVLSGKTAVPLKPRIMLDISDAYRILGEITKMAERVWKDRAANAISRKDLARVAEMMAADVAEVVGNDPEILKAVRTKWSTIALRAKL